MNEECAPVAKVSVLVPVYGVEKYIERCAVSLFEQTYEDVEYIFVDDCSPDRSVSILRSVVELYPKRKAQVRIVSNEKNLGLGATRARALDEATGEGVMHVDSDDYLPPQAIELLWRKMQETDADIVDGAWQRVTPNGVSQPIMPYQGRNAERYLRLLLCQNIVQNNVWGKLFKRSLYTKHGINGVAGIDLAEDYSLMARLMLHAKRAFITDSVYFYCDDNAVSYTHTTSPRHVRSLLRANRVVMDYYAANDPNSRYLVPLQMGITNALRCARRNGFSMSEALDLLDYHPKGALFRALAAMMRGRCPLRVAETAYLIVRRLYRLVC